ncbi:MAG: hypothetical protein WBY53_20410 [Acidobacteriaceae bacterium]
MNEPAEVTARLIARLEALEQRVFQLEHPSEALPLLSPPIDSAPLLQTMSPTAAVSPAANAGSVFTTLGKAILGMAGAYLLRALTEAGTFPRQIVVILAIAYAVLWLAAAARVTGEKLFARVAYALTSALILAPMLWELTLHFRVLSPAVTAAILAAFAIAALALTWKTANTPVFWIAYVTTSVTALALMIATQDLPPFLCALLIIALEAEFASLRNHLLKARIFAAVALDLATGSLLYIYSLDVTARASYANVATPWLIALAAAPLLLYFISITLHVTLKERTLSIFEIVQGTLVLSFAAYGATHLGGSPVETGVGILSIALGVVLYSIAFFYFSRKTPSRAFAAYTTWGAATFALGSILLLSASSLAGVMAIAALACTALGIRYSHLVLEFHGALYLLAAAFFSSLAGFDHHLLLDPQSASPTWSIGAAFLCSLLCYGITLRVPKDATLNQMPPLVSAATAAATASAFAVYVLVRISAAIHPTTAAAGPGPIPILQTISLCAATLALAALGSRRRRTELVWLAYVTVALTAAKVLLMDVRHETLLAIAITFIFYATTLILLPRIIGRAPHETIPSPVTS